MSIVLCFAFLCEFEDCRAQALISPLEIVTEYCQLDFEGARLSSKTWSKVSQLIMWEHEPGWDGLAVVSGFKVKTLTTNGNKSEVEIKYDYLGSLSGSTWRSSKDKEASVNRTDRTVVFILERVDNAWLIKKPMISPHVSLTVVIDHLSSLTNNASDRGRPRSQLEIMTTELKKIAASLSSPEVQTQDVQFDKLTIERLGNHIKSIPGNIDVLAKVDTTFVQLVDITFDGEPDSVILNIKAESLMHPFVWSLKVQSKGRTIFERLTDDSGIDKLFDEQGYVLDKQSPYIDSKRYYYFEYMFENIIKERRFKPESHIVNRLSSISVYYVARKNLINKHQVSEQEADIIVETVAERLLSGTLTLNVPGSPVIGWNPIIYVPEIGAFVAFYYP